MKYYTLEPHCGFWDDRYGDAPEGAIELSDEEYSELFKGQAQGKQIDFSSGKPKLVDIKLKIDDIEKWARSVRNSTRDNLDKLLNPASTIKGVLVTDEQKQQIIEYSVKLANWPDTKNWPLIPFPEVPVFLVGTIAPSWDYQNYKNRV